MTSASSSNSQRPQQVTSEALKSVEIDQLIPNDTIIDVSYIHSCLMQAKSDLGQPDSTLVMALDLLIGVTSMYLNVDTPGEPFGPILVWDGQRTMIPDDIKGSQTNELESFIPFISNDGLRTRIADVVWVNDRSKVKAAQEAIKGYILCVEQYYLGHKSFQYSGSKSALCHQVFELLRRCCQIVQAIKGKRAYPEEIVELIKLTSDKSYSDGDAYSVANCLKLMTDFDIEAKSESAQRTQEFLKNATDTSFPEKVAVLEELQRLYTKLEQKDIGHECALQIAECYVGLASVEASTSIASTHWLTKALEQLRAIKGDKARKRAEEVKTLLREVQEDTNFELGSFSEEVDIKDLVEAQIQRFQGLTLGEALGVFASIAVSEDPEKLKDQAKEQMSKSFFLSLFSSAYVDDEGKVIAKNDGSGLDGSGDEEAMLFEISQQNMFTRGMFVASGIEPARHLIQTKLNLTKAQLGLICNHSPFIPKGHEAIFLQGFHSFFLGDMICAGSTLIPQLENSLRYVLKCNDIDTSTIESDLTQNDRAISQLLGKYRPEMVGVFSEPIVFEIDLLFNSRVGPALRHNIAHGKLSSDDFYSHEVMYACWFIFRLACMPLFGRWEEVSQQIDRL